MKKRKIILIVVSSLGFICFQSCADKINNSGLEELNESSKEVAVQIQQEKTNVQYFEPIYETQNAEFCQGEFVQSLPQRMRMRKSKSEEANDTITSAEEIPITSKIESTQDIYMDGTFKYVSLDKTTDDMKIIEKLNVNPQPESEKVNKTEIKNNMVNLYNSEGKLLKSEKLGDINFKPMIDSLQAYLASQTNSVSNSPQKLKQLRISRALARATASGMRLVSQSETEVVLEMNMGVTKSSIPLRSKASYVKKAIMCFSPDMTRMYSQKIYEGGQLVQSLEIGFASDNEPQFSNSLSGFDNQMLPTANVKFIKQKRLATKPDGTPYIMNNGELYTKNTVKYNFKDK